MHRATIVTLIAAGSLALAAPAFAACKDATVEAKGNEMQEIDKATESAVDALIKAIAAQHGKEWGVGPRRNGSYHCDKFLGGRKPGWTCTARTTVICAADKN